MRYGISAAVLLVRNERVLLVNHKKSGRYDFWVPPVGRVEADEPIFECARRETFEETGPRAEPRHISGDMVADQITFPDCATYASIDQVCHRIDYERSAGRGCSMITARDPGLPCRFSGQQEPRHVRGRSATGHRS